MDVFRPVGRCHLVAAILLLVLSVRPALAQDTRPAPPIPPPWELLAAGQPTDPFTAVRAFDGGLVFAQDSHALWRSDDAGISWTNIVGLSEDGLRRVVLDALNPSDLSTMYALARRGLSKSTDGGLSWSLVFDSKPVIGFARSNVDPELLYLGASQSSSQFSFLRSPDGGAHWDEMSAASASMCNSWFMPVLLPHPADLTQVFRAASCPSGRGPGAPLETSTDQGATWTNISRTDLGGTATRMVAGDPSRHHLYIVVHKTDSDSSRAVVFRTDDDGTRWQLVLDQRAQWSFEGAGGRVQFQIPTVALTPADPRRVYIGVNQLVSVGAFGTPPVVVSRISRGEVPDSPTASYTSWVHLEALDLGRLHDLSLSPDGTYLFAASEKGLWRLPQPASQPLR